jgi:hypothetical protein
MRAPSCARPAVTACNDPDPQLDRFSTVGVKAPGRLRHASDAEFARETPAACDLATHTSGRSNVYTWLEGGEHSILALAIPQIKPLHKRTVAHHFCQFGTGEDKQIEAAISSCNPSEQGYFVLV